MPLTYIFVVVIFCCCFCLGVVVVFVVVVFCVFFGGWGVGWIRPDEELYASLIITTSTDPFMQAAAYHWRSMYAFGSEWFHAWAKSPLLSLMLGCLAAVWCNSNGGRGNVKNRLVQDRLISSVAELQMQSNTVAYIVPWLQRRHNTWSIFETEIWFLIFNVQQLGETQFINSQVTIWFTFMTKSFTLVEEWDKICWN